MKKLVFRVMITLLTLALASLLVLMFLNLILPKSFYSVELVRWLIPVPDVVQLMKFHPIIFGAMCLIHLILVYIAVVMIRVHIAGFRDGINYQRYSQKVSDVRRITQTFKLTIEGFSSSRNLEINARENISLYDITLPGCVIGPYCNICKQRVADFKPSMPFEVIETSNAWRAKIFGIPSIIDEKSLSEFLGNTVRCVKKVN